MIKDEAVCLRTVGATIVVVLIVVETQPKHAPLVHLIIERGSNRGFIDATIVIRHDDDDDDDDDAADWDEANAPHDDDDVYSDFCESVKQTLWWEWWISMIITIIIMIIATLRLLRRRW